MDIKKAKIDINYFLNEIFGIELSKTQLDLFEKIKNNPSVFRQQGNIFNIYKSILGAKTMQELCLPDLINKFAKCPLCHKGIIVMKSRGKKHQYFCMTCFKRVVIPTVRTHKITIGSDTYSNREYAQYAEIKILKQKLKLINNKLRFLEKSRNKLTYNKINKNT